MPDAGFKVSSEKDFLTLVMWDAAAGFVFTDSSLTVTIEKDTNIMFKLEEDYDNFKSVHQSNAPNENSFQEIFKEMVARPSLISIRNRPPSLACYSVYKRKASFLGIREERADWTEHLLSMEKVWEG